MPEQRTLRLWQLISPTLPVGAYAYSAGLETAVADGRVSDAPSLADWLAGQSWGVLAKVDLPVLLRLMAAWEAGDREAVGYWTQWLRAARETAELRAEDEHMGRALARLLAALGEADAGSWDAPGHASWATLFALAASRWDIPPEEAAAGYLWAWLENQVAAGVKLIPLGQTVGQAVLFELAAMLPEVVGSAGALADGALGAAAPGLAIASSRHETQYTRLFRS
ncbi:urease accessory protein UreF [Arhodomonas sp. SL1]|uniref:urease accessory protein UreF n=1 Tax=Arhodomonas sp. SL1 TaxID=3425691 RepID=UPI003F88269B